MLLDLPLDPPVRPVQPFAPVELRLSYHRWERGEHLACEFQTDCVNRPGRRYPSKADMILWDRSQLIQNESPSGVCWNVHGRVQDATPRNIPIRHHPHGKRLV